MNFLLLTLLFVMGIFDFVNSQITYGRCFTPDEFRGNCIKFHQCKPLFELTQKKPSNRQDRLFISLSQCGFRDGQPLVCCRDAPRPSPGQPQPAATSKNAFLPKPGICGSDESNRIYGGNRTEIDEYPWMALLGYLKPQNEIAYKCGGSLISEKYVLTASHCVIGKNNSPLPLSHVRLGEWDLTTDQDCDDSLLNERVCSTSPINIEIEQIIPHPQFDPFDTNHYNDIALLRLKQAVKYNEFIKPICLPIDEILRSNDFVKQTLSVAGWGKTEKVLRSDIKLKVNVDGVSSADCNIFYEKYQIIDSQICAGGKKGEDSCGGDSGGPLMRLFDEGTPPYWYLAGIVSYGPKSCGKEGHPAVYTRVSNYIPWIEQEVKA